MDRNNFSVMHLDTGREWRGGQRQVLILHKGLLNAGIDSHLVCNKFGALYKQCKKEEIPRVYPLEYENKVKTGEYEKAADIIEPDIVHTHDSHALSLALKLKNDFLLVNTRRVSYPIKFLSRKLKYAQVDVHVGVSISIGKMLSKYFKHVHTIPSCIELSRFKPERQKDVLENPKDINILFVGAFSKQKGVDVLIRAAGELDKIHRNVQFHFVGGGDLETEMHNLTEELGISNITSFYGARYDVENFYKSADMLVVPSVDGEGSSGVIKEGMACGLKVIASNLPENMELGEDGEHLLFFKNSDHNDLCNMIDNVIENRDGLNKNIILEKSQEFDCSNLIEKYERLYKQYLES